MAIGAVAVAIAAWRLSSGLPGFVERRISKAASSDTARAEIGNVSFNFAKMAIKVGSFVIYPTEKPETAAISVTGAEIAIRPSSFTPQLGWLKEVAAESVLMNVDAVSSLSGDSSSGGAMPEVGPVHVRIRRLSALGMEIRNLGGIVSLEDGAISISESTASFNGPGEPEQTLRWNLGVDLSAPAIEASASGKFNIAKLSPLLRALDCAGIAEELDKFEFHSIPPQVDASFFRDTKHDARSFLLSVNSGPMHYNGVRVSSFEGVLRARGKGSWNRYDIDPIEFTRPEGTAKGNFSFDAESDTLSVNWISSVDPLQLLALVGLHDLANTGDIEFEGPTELRCSGTLGFGDGDAARTSLRFGGSAQCATVRGFRFSGVEAAGSAHGDAIDISRISADAMGGSLQGSFRISDDGDEKTVSATLSLENIPQSQWAGLIGRQADAAAGGFLDAKATFNGPFSELGGKVPERGSGTVAIDVHDAVLFRIPLFAGLTDIIAGFIPGIDLLVDQNEASVRATLEDGKWNLSQLSVSGHAFSIDGSGVANADGTGIDIVARVRLMNRKTWLGRLIRRILSPVSGLFGVRATGSLDEPRWNMAPFSKSSAK